MSQMVLVLFCWKTFHNFWHLSFKVMYITVDDGISQGCKILRVPARKQNLAILFTCSDASTRVTSFEVQSY